MTGNGSPIVSSHSLASLPSTPTLPHPPSLLSTSPSLVQQQRPIRSPNQGKLRRKALITETKNDLTAVQRLVEYFVVVSSEPRWGPPPPPSSAPPTPKSPPSPPSTARIRKTRRKSVFETREETQSMDSGDPGELQNIHMPTLGSQHDHTFSPKITARYPLRDYDDNPLNPMIIHFCYPSGDVIVPSQSYEMPRIHHFVLTNDKGRKIYGTCLTVFEEFIPSGNDPWKSRAVREEESQQDDGVEVQVDERQKILYIPKVICLLSTWAYLSAFREYLSQLYRLATTTNVMSAPIERYIVNICREVPAPPPGAFEVQMSILDSTIRFWAPPAKLPLAYVSLPYQILFDCLDLDNLLLLWSAMLLERKVLLISSQYSVLTICSEILCSLLFPMRWSHLYVPLLPRMLCPMLDAPVPYLCGIVRESWLHAEQFVSDETIVVDLDHNEVRMNDFTPPLPQLPPKKFNKLNNVLNETVGHVFWRSRGLEKEYRKGGKRSVEKLRMMVGQNSQWWEKHSGLDHAFNLAYTPDSQMLEEFSSTEDEYMQSQWDRVQEAFLRFFVALLKDYRRYLHVPANNITPTIPPVKPSFDRIAFLASQKVENASFLMELFMTQQFDDFITKRMYSPGEPDLEFFDQSIDAKMNRSKLKLKKVETPFLQSAKTHKQLKKFNAVAPNESGLSEYSYERILKPYVYKRFPDSFKESLFASPRPIPKIISIEFDRQATLAQSLRADFGEEDEDDDDVMEFFGGDYDPSPEVASFTVFLFSYCALVGLDWQDYEQRRRLQEEKLSREHGEKIEQREAVPEEIETVLPPSAEVIADRADTTSSGFMSDLTMGLCDACPEGGFNALKQTLLFISDGTDEAYNSFMAKATDQMVNLANIQIQAPDVNDTNNTNRDVSLIDEYDEAREVASAQLDLAFEVLQTMTLRGLSTDSDAYKSLIEACGRCGDTQRALSLMKVMKNDGFVADSEVLSCFVAAFANHGSGGVDIGNSSPVRGVNGEAKKGGPDAYSSFLRKSFLKHNGIDVAEDDSTEDLSDNQSQYSKIVDSYSLESSSMASGRIRSSTRSSGAGAFFDWFTMQNNSSEKPNRFLRRRKRRKPLDATLQELSPVTEMVSHQLGLGDSLLDFLYPNLIIDTNSESCPHCSHVMSEHDIVNGWIPCSFHNYTTRCSNCDHRFVPRFVVSCNSPTFVGSQGPRTPLYCEFLSPWVMRKAIQHVVKGDIGIRGMLNPQWRDSTDIRATLFWNMIALCRRHRLPYTFLLQGSFQNRLILPRMPNES